MRTVSAAELHAQCLSILDQLEPEGVVITKDGEPIARLVPIERSHAELIGSLRGKIAIKGDILSTGVEWEAGA